MVFLDASRCVLTQFSRQSHEMGAPLSGEETEEQVEIRQLAVSPQATELKVEKPGAGRDPWLPSKFVLSSFWLSSVLAPR